MNEVLNIPMEKIRPPWVAMKLVNRDTLDYRELRDSIQAIGLLNSVSVRQSAKHEGMYELIDGLHRYSVAKELDFSHLPCILVDGASDYDVIAAQIQAQVCRRRNHRVQLATHLKRLMMANPELTYDALAAMVNKSPTWIERTLHLTNLSDEARKFVEQCDISVTIAISLAYLPKFMQDKMLPDALEMPVREFLEKCRRHRKTYRDAIRQGRLVEYTTQYDIDPIPLLRDMESIKHEIREKLYGESLMERHPDMSPIEIWDAALRWVVQLDEDSVAHHYDKYKRQQEKLETRFIKGSRAVEFATERSKVLGMYVDPKLRDLTDEFMN